MENHTTKPRKVKMVLPEELVYLILQWLPVISLLRFKLVCKTWRAFIESSNFIKQHLHHHHYGLSLKDKSHTLIRLFKGKDSPFTFGLISIDSFEEPNTCVQLDCSFLYGCSKYSPVEVLQMVSYNGIICLNLSKSNREQSICLWNPATKQSRVLPRSTSPNMTMALTVVGFGFDVKSNDYKVVNLIKSHYGYPTECRVEVYGLSTSSWRSLNTSFPSGKFYESPRMPFNNGTCFFWWVYNPFNVNEGFLSFDFSIEMFRSISLPRANYGPLIWHVSVVHDKIACVFMKSDCRLETWVLNEYGSANESWAVLYKIDLFPTVIMPIEWLSTSGNYIFFEDMRRMYRYNVTTGEMKTFPAFEKLYWTFNEAAVESKESVVSVGQAKSAPASFSGNKNKGKH